mgnify:FL=1
MTNSLSQPAALELPRDLQIIHDRIKTTDSHVLALHALLDLLNKPDDQRESLGEMLASLLKSLAETQLHYQAQLEKMSSQIVEMQQQINAAADAEREQRRNLDRKLDCILTLLGMPND